MIWQDGLLDGNLPNTKLRITIPKDPDLETAHRALRYANLFSYCSKLVFVVEGCFTVMTFEYLPFYLSFRAKSSKDNSTSTVRRFKALPLNRKVSIYAFPVILCISK